MKKINLTSLLGITIMIFIFSGCKKEEKAILPQLTTKIVSNISGTTAMSGGNIISDGGAPIIVKGVCWGKTENPTVADLKTTDGIGFGSFTSTISGLTEGEKYHVRAYATNSIGTAYGEDLSISTLSRPVLITSIVSDITLSSAMSGGNINFDGGSPVIARGVCWNTVENPTIANSKTIDGIGTGAFSSAISGLSEGEKYHVRAYATNSVGTTYGVDLSFSTFSKPILTTVVISSITLSSAISGGNITSDGGNPITTKGVCWSSTENPTIADSKTIDGGIGSFSSVIQNLAEGSNYYVRSYATNFFGTSYGNQISFTTNLSDIDGNVYRTIRIGKQIWMVENLKVTHYQNNDPIIKSIDNTLWLNINYGVYCNYNNDENNAVLYGKLYNWYAISDSRKLCPPGWHVPTVTDWETLGSTLGGMDIAGGKMKEAGSTHWTGINAGANNTSGFTALPGGRKFDDNASSGNLTTDGFWWSASEYDASNAWSIYIYTSAAYLGKTNMERKSMGFSIRCVRD